MHETVFVLILRCRQDLVSNQRHNNTFSICRLFQRQTRLVYLGHSGHSDWFHSGPDTTDYPVRVAVQKGHTSRQRGYGRKNTW